MMASTTRAHAHRHADPDHGPVQLVREDAARDRQHQRSPGADGPGPDPCLRAAWRRRSRRSSSTGEITAAPSTQPISSATCWRQGVAPTSQPVFRSCRLSRLGHRHHRRGAEDPSAMVIHARRSSLPARRPGPASARDQHDGDDAHARDRAGRRAHQAGRSRRPRHQESRRRRRTAGTQRRPSRRRRAPEVLQRGDGHRTSVTRDPARRARRPGPASAARPTRWRRCPRPRSGWTTCPPGRPCSRRPPPPGSRDEGEQHGVGDQLPDGHRRQRRVGQEDLERDDQDGHQHQRDEGDPARRQVASVRARRGPCPPCSGPRTRP